VLFRSDPTEALSSEGSFVNDTNTVYYILNKQTPLQFNAWNKFNFNFTDLAVSYFVGLHADETKAEAILAGDRNLRAARNRNLYSSVEAGGAIHVSQTSTWSDAWPPAPHGAHGNVALADGSVQQATSQKLQQLLLKATNAYGPHINLFLFPQ